MLFDWYNRVSNRLPMDFVPDRLKNTGNLEYGGFKLTSKTEWLTSLSKLEVFLDMVPKRRGFKRNKCEGRNQPFLKEFSWKVIILLLPFYISIFYIKETSEISVPYTVIWL